MLEIQSREYAEAVEKRASASEIKMMQAVHKRDLREAIKRQEQAGDFLE